MSSHRLIGRPVCLRLSAELRTDRRGAHTAPDVPVRRGPWPATHATSSPTTPALGPLTGLPQRRTAPPVRHRVRPRTPDWTSHWQQRLVRPASPPRRGSQARAPVLRGPPGEVRLQPLDWEAPARAQRAVVAGYGRDLPLDLASLPVVLPMRGEAAGLFRAHCAGVAA